MVCDRETASGSCLISSKVLDRGLASLARNLEHLESLSPSTLIRDGNQRNVAGQKAMENNKGKENGGASDVMDPIQKELNFTTLAMGTGNAYLHGVLTYDIGCREWSWKRLRRIGRSDRGNSSGQYDKPFAVEGLVLISHIHVYTRGVFDVHANLWHEIPPEPEYGEATRVLGMTVDASAKPCTFKLIVGSQDTGTQIYDSRTGKWVRKASRLMRCLHPGPTYVENSCLHANGCAYIRAENDVTVVYSLETDTWSKLQLPQRQKDESVAQLGSMGRADLHCDGELFHISLSLGAG